MAVPPRLNPAAPLWVCAAAWMVPPVDCDAHGEGDSAAERHTKQTGHSTITSLTTRDYGNLRAKRVLPYADHPDYREEWKP